MLTMIPHTKITYELAEQVVEKIQAASPCFEVDPDVYIENLMSGFYLMWGHENAVLIGKVVMTPDRVKVLELDTACLWGTYKGDFREALSQVEKEAKMAGINRIVIKGREGWRKIHRDYSHYCTTIYKEL